jgi:hypothetical protein
MWEVAEVRELYPRSTISGWETAAISISWWRTSWGSGIVTAVNGLAHTANHPTAVANLGCLQSSV